LSKSGFGCHRNYKSRDSGCIYRMLKDLELSLLEERRKQLRLTFMFKVQNVVEGLIPTIPLPASEDFEPVQ